MRQKLLRALASAIGNLENSIKALAEKDERELRDHVWRAAADAEYALFLLSLVQQEEIKGSPPESGAYAKKVEVEPALVLAQDLLNEAKDNIDIGGLHEAYGKVWGARGYLLRASTKLEEMATKRKKQD